MVSTGYLTHAACRDEARSTSLCHTGANATIRATSSGFGAVSVVEKWMTGPMTPQLRGLAPSCSHPSDVSFGRARHTSRTAVTGIGDPWLAAGVSDPALRSDLELERGGRGHN